MASKKRKADYIAPGSAQHKAVLGYEDSTAERQAQLDLALKARTLEWVATYDKTPIGRNTPPGLELPQGFKRRRPI